MEKRVSGLWRGVIGVSAVAMCGLGSMVGVAGCETTDDSSVGHTKTVTKTTVDTPNQKTTTTETHEKNTTLDPNR